MAVTLVGVRKQLKEMCVSSSARDCQKLRDEEGEKHKLFTA